MKFQRPTVMERQIAKTERKRKCIMRYRRWHLKFAWWPVRLKDQDGSETHTVVWLEYVARIDLRGIGGTGSNKPYWRHGPVTFLLTQPP